MYSCPEHQGQDSKPVLSEPTEEMELVEQRREEEPTSMPQELEVNVDNIRQWQAMDPTLVKACDEAGNEASEGDIRVGFYYSDGLLYPK